MSAGRVFASGEDTHTLRLKSKLFDLRVGYVNRHSATLLRAEPSSNPRSAPPRNEKKHPDGMLHFLEVQAGFEPAGNGVADRGLTTWLLHQTFDCPYIIAKQNRFVKAFLLYF